MSKLYITIGIIAACGAFGLTIKAYGDSRERQGYLSAINAQQQTDIQHATVTMNKQNGYYADALKMASGITQDGTETSVDLGRVLDKLQPASPARAIGK